VTASPSAAVAYLQSGFVEMTREDYEVARSHEMRTAGMTVGQLIEQLQNFDPSMRVIVLGEHQPSPLETVENALYVPEEIWCGDLVHPDDATGQEEHVVWLEGIN
jgi:hypothetical protein